jgi:hypothetical protein
MNIEIRKDDIQKINIDHNYLGISAKVHAIDRSPCVNRNVFDVKCDYGTYANIINPRLPIAHSSGFGDRASSWMVSNPASHGAQSCRGGLSGFLPALSFR